MLQEWISEHELVIGALDNFSSREEQLNYFFFRKNMMKKQGTWPQKELSNATNPIKIENLKWVFLFSYIQRIVQL